ncbi:MAG TPA: hydroxymethylbilane synthase [Nocardioidaceae bacterium]|nr:hydroxymethylbilane synthase [Nocardioidaceae bacterium]
MTALRLGTRASALATAQATLVADAIKAASGRDVELVPVLSRGDVDTAPLTEIGGEGVFVTALRQALVEGRVDAAVHSLKDLPTATPAGITLAAVPAREDPRDVVVARDGLSLSQLPPGAVVGTGAPRRAAQLHALGFGLDVRPIRGNVDSRIAAVEAGTVDAVVLARAGLARLGRLDAVSEVLDPLLMLPAPGQGALAVECRGNETVTTELLATALDDPGTRCAVTAERTVLATLQGGCSAPVGALADLALGDDGDELWLRAVAVAPDGSRQVRLSTTGAPSDAELLGASLAHRMIDEGAAGLFENDAS